TFALHVGFASAVGDTFTVLDNTTSGPTTLTLGSSLVTADNGQRFSVRLVGNDVVLRTEDTAPMFQNRTATTPIRAGGIATATGTIVEPDSRDVFFLDVEWGDGTVEHFRFDPGSSRDVSISHRYLEDSSSTPSGRYTIHLAWRDQHGLGNSGDLEVAVLN